ncbi:hypothetical protein FOZ62_022275, partial [Perkinsus olseni]
KYVVPSPTYTTLASAIETSNHRIFWSALTLIELRYATLARPSGSSPARVTSPTSAVATTVRLSSYSVPQSTPASSILGALVVYSPRPYSGLRYSPVKVELISLLKLSKS